MSDLFQTVSQQISEMPDESSTAESIAELLRASFPLLGVSATGGEVNHKIPVQCPQCGTGVTINGTRPVIFNSGRVSILIYMHKPAVCSGCSREYVPAITNADLKCSLAEAVPESRILMPNGGFAS